MDTKIYLGFNHVFTSTHTHKQTFVRLRHILYLNNKFICPSEIIPILL